jgi:hypothetical protein
MIRKHTTILCALILTVGLAQPDATSAGVPTDRLRHRRSRARDSQRPGIEFRWRQSGATLGVEQSNIAAIDFAEMAKRLLQAPSGAAGRLRNKRNSSGCLPSC